MIRIYDQFFATPQSQQLKTVFGTLKHRQHTCDQYQFVDSTDKPYIILLAIDCASVVSGDVINEIVRIYNSSTVVSLIIDTTIEAFVNDAFYFATSILETKGIKSSDITVITSEQNSQVFADTYCIRYTVKSINMFELYYLQKLEQNLESNYILNAPIRPRKLAKHFIDYKKNPRFTRKMFNAFMRVNDYDQIAYYSWHKSNGYSLEDNEALKRLGIIPFDTGTEQFLTKLNSIVLPESTAQNFNEWALPDNVCKSGGINLVHETCPHIKEYSDIVAYPYDSTRLFLTEKVYKNFAYGIPMLSPGIPGFERMLSDYNYKTWESFFDVKISDSSNYANNIKEYFKLITHIAEMSISDLEDLLNSEQSLNYCKHNKTIFLEQHEFLRLLDVLQNAFDK